MGTADRREREKRELHDKILAAARDLFVEEGYDAVTMRRVAARIEYSTTAIYLMWKDKDALLREVAQSDFAALGAEFQRIGRCNDPMQKLYRLGAAYIQFGLSHPNHYRFMFMTPRPMSTGAPPPDDPQQGAYAALRGACAEAIASGCLRAEVRNADSLAQMLWAAVHGMVSLFIVVDPCAPSPIDWRSTKHTARFLLDTLMAGLLR